MTLNDINQQSDLYWSFLMKLAVILGPAGGVAYWIAVYQGADHILAWIGVMFVTLLTYTVLAKRWARKQRT